MTGKGRISEWSAAKPIEWKYIILQVFCTSKISKAFIPPDY